MFRIKRIQILAAVIAGLAAMSVVACGSSGNSTVTGPAPTLESVSAPVAPLPQAAAFQAAEITAPAKAVVKAAAPAAVDLGKDLAAEELRAAAEQASRAPAASAAGAAASLEAGVAIKVAEQLAEAVADSSPIPVLAAEPTVTPEPEPEPETRPASAETAEPIETPEPEPIETTEPDPTPTPTSQPTPAPTPVLLTTFDEFGFRLGLDLVAGVQSAGGSAEDQGAINFSSGGVNAILTWIPEAGSSPLALVSGTYDTLQNSQAGILFESITEGAISVNAQSGVFLGFKSSDASGATLGGGLIGAWTCADTGTAYTLTLTSSDATSLQIRFDRLLENFTCAA